MADRSPDANQETAYPWWLLRIWHGMTMGVWLAMLRRHGFRIAPSRYGLAVYVTLFSISNSLLAGFTRLRYRARVRRAVVDPNILVLVGHHRSGTTLLHELMVTDPRWSYADTYQCFSPSHWLYTRKYVGGGLKKLLLSQRPEDGMVFSLELPQEDEFALMNLGAPSHYECMAFPSDAETPWQAVDLENGDPGLRRLWQETFAGFLRALAVVDPRPVVLKSPLHIARMGLILERFPQARFVHIRRDPYRVVPSMLGMTRNLYEMHRFQPIPDYLLDDVLRLYRSVFTAFDRDLPKIDPDRFHELTYEDLVADPKRELRRLYAALGLEGFDPERPELRQRLEEMKGFRPQVRPIPAAGDLDKMEACFGDRARKWGYTRPAG